MSLHHLLNNSFHEKSSPPFDPSSTLSPISPTPPHRTYRKTRKINRFTRKNHYHRRSTFFFFWLFPFQKYIFAGEKLLFLYNLFFLCRLIFDVLRYWYSLPHVLLSPCTIFKKVSINSTAFCGVGVLRKWKFFEKISTEFSKGRGITFWIPGVGGLQKFHLRSILICMTTCERWGVLIYRFREVCKGVVEISHYTILSSEFAQLLH